MDDLSRKFRGIDWKGLQKSARKMQASTASALKDMVMTDLENKTRSVTADTAWGASNTDLTLIAQGTYNRDDYGLIMSIVWQRLSSTRWRCVHKSLHLLTFLVMHGSARCAEEARAALPHLRALEAYTARENGREMAEGVRLRASKLCDMLSDPQVLEQEREESNRLRGKITGGSGSTSNFSSHLGNSSGPGMNSSMRYAGFASDTSYYSSNPQSNLAGQATFQGYDDDGDVVNNQHYSTGLNPHAKQSAFGYDDEAPTGTFAKRAAAAARMNGTPNGQGTVDLLSDEPVNGNPNDLAPDIDDDDDFDPRAPTGASSNAAPPAHATGSDADLFNSLALVPSNNDNTGAAPPAFATNSQPQKSMPTSQLVQRLAAAATTNHSGNTTDVPAMNSTQTNQTSMGTVATNMSTGTSAVNATNSNPFTGFSEQVTTATDGNSAQTQLNANTTSAPAPKKLERKETDPFGDLLSTAKQKGVL